MALTREQAQQKVKVEKKTLPKERRYDINVKALELGKIIKKKKPETMNQMDISSVREGIDRLKALM